MCRKRSRRAVNVLAQTEHLSSDMVVVRLMKVPKIASFYVFVGQLIIQAIVLHMQSCEEGWYDRTANIGKTI